MIETKRTLIVDRVYKYPQCVNLVFRKSREVNGLQNIQMRIGNRIQVFIFPGRNRGKTGIGSVIHVNYMGHDVIPL